MSGGVQQTTPQQQQTNANAYTFQANTAVVANSFVLKYYTMLNTSPQSLYHFYKENSIFSHGHEDPNAGIEEETVFGKENINKKLQSLNFQDCKVTLSVVDSQYGVDGGVLISVIGHISNRNEQPRKFVQTFVLAVQTEPVGYYVRNDIFRYLKETSFAINIPQAESPAQNHVAQEESTPTPKEEEQVQQVVEEPKPALPVQQPQQKATPQVSVPVVSAHPQITTNVPVNTTSISGSTTPPEDKKSVQANSVSSDVKPTQPKKEKEEKKPDQVQSENHVKHEKKHDKRREGKGKQQQTQQQQQSNATEKPKQSNAASSKPTWANIAAKAPAEGTNKPEDQQPQQPTKPVVQPQQPTQQKPVENNNKPVEDKEEKDDAPRGPSLYINNLPFAAKEEQVRSMFAPFGSIKYLSWRSSRGYAFVEYENPEVVQQVIERSRVTQFVMDGRPLNVEERKTKAGSNKSRENKVPRKDKENKERKDKPQIQGQQQQGQQSPRQQTQKKQQQQQPVQNNTGRKSN